MRASLDFKINPDESLFRFLNGMFALASLAACVLDPSLYEAIGGAPEVVLPREVYLRAQVTLVKSDEPRSLLEYMHAHFPGITCRPAT